MILKAENINKHFGGVHALNNVKFELEEAEIHALLGENGAGKSTLGKIFAGVHKYDTGLIYYKEQEFCPANTIEAQRAGISIIFQELDLFMNLTVAENIVLKNLHFRENYFVNRKNMHDFCKPYLKKVGLKISSDEMLESLSIGQMQLVAIARALSMQVRIIIMDEPTSSLTDDSVENLFTLIKELKSNGVSIIYISHKMEEIFRITDRITVMRDGEYIAVKKTKNTDMNELIKLMVGREIRGKLKSSSHYTEETILEVENLQTGKLDNISFTLNRGEVLGIAGLVGAGRSEIGRALFGLDKITGGTININGNLCLPKSPAEAIKNSIGLVPEDRKIEGLMMQMSNKENLSIAALEQYNTACWLNKKKENESYQKISLKTKLKAANPDAEVSTLSGGNQQKVLLGRWLMMDQNIYFFDDPTRGVDVGAKEDIYSIIEKLAAEKKGIIFVSSELSELLRCCDRIMVMNNYSSAGILDANKTSQESILKLAAVAQEQETVVENQ